MSNEILDDRRQALESAFFRKENDRLLEQLRTKREAEEQRAELARICGVANSDFLDGMLALNVTAESFVALCVAPLVAVAWADTHMSPTERRTILDEASDMGIADDSPAAELLRGWLESRPPHQLVEEWEHYVQMLSAQLSESDRAGFADDVMGRVRKVAKAAGGVLGLGSKISQEEREMLERLERAFRV